MAKTDKIMETKTLEQRLLEAQMEIGTISKDGTNPHFKSKYATLPQIISEVKPILNKHGLLLTQPIKDNVVYSMISFDNNSMVSGIKLPEGLNAQQIGSAITYFRRYTLASLLSLEIEDDDGNEASKPDDKIWLNENSKEYQQALDFLKTGGKLEAIEKKYKIATKTREKLLSQAI